MIKHRQLARQVGALLTNFFESSADLDIKMSFPMGTTFIFRSWICKVDGDGRLQSCLIEKSDYEDVKIDQMEEQQLIEKMIKLSTSSPSRTDKEEGYETDSETENKTDYNSKTIIKIPQVFRYGLQNSASIVQEYNTDQFNCYLFLRKKQRS